MRELSKTEIEVVIGGSPIIELALASPIIELAPASPIIEL